MKDSICFCRDLLWLNANFKRWPLSCHKYLITACDFLFWWARCIKGACFIDFIWAVSFYSNPNTTDLKILCKLNKDWFKCFHIKHVQIYQRAVQTTTLQLLWLRFCFFCQQHSAPILQSTFCSAIACNLGEAVADSKGFCRPLFIQDGRKTSAKMRQKMTEGKVILRSTKSRTNLMKKRIWSHYIQHCSFTAGQH